MFRFFSGSCLYKPFKENEKCFCRYLSGSFSSVAFVDITKLFCFVIISDPVCLQWFYRSRSFFFINSIYKFIKRNRAVYLGNLLPCQLLTWQDRQSRSKSLFYRNEKIYIPALFVRSMTCAGLPAHRYRMP